MKRSLALFMSLSAALLVAGCGINKPFVLMDENYKIKPSSIAIVAGDNSGPTVKLVEVLSKDMAEKTSFRIMSQDEIRRRIPKYPFAIATTIPSDGAKPVWYDAAEKVKFDSIQARLKVPYLFVIWSEGVQMQTVCNNGGGCSTSYYMSVKGNLVEYPKGRPVTFTHITENKSPHLYNLTIFRSNNYFVDSMIGDATDKITDEIVSITGSKG